jgi:hypothetical protein
MSICHGRPSCSDPDVGGWTAKDPILFASGEGALVGGILGGVVGGTLFGIPGLIIGGVVGTLLGSMIDPAHAGRLNYGHDEMFRHEIEMAKAELLLKEYIKIREQLEEWEYHMGGPLNNNRCK